jgi:hypothetical protein
MAFGIDTSQAHLDLLTEIRAAADFAAADPAGSFFTWNGGARPVFAGRNFLGGNSVGGDFIWGHSEATNASKEPDGNGRGGRAVYPLPATDPSPDQQQNLTVLVDRIAPMQASHTRQQTTGDMGRVLGQIDGDALCKRLVNGILSGEFSLGLVNPGFLDVWLCIDPTVPLSADYWAGWSDTVNTAVLPVSFPGIVSLPQQLFRASVFCTYTAGADQVLRPDAALTATLALNPAGMVTTVHGFWADFKLFDNAPADLVANGNPLLDFTRFDAATAPKLWRFANGYTDTTGATPAVSFHLDAASPTLTPTDTMLQAQQWQPSVGTIQNVGFSNLGRITDANVACIQGTAWPDMDDNNFVANAGHFHVRGGPVTVLGRYLVNFVFDEVQRLGGTGVSLFSIWEGSRTLAGIGLAVPAMKDFNTDPPHDWGDFNANINVKKNIFYFNPDPDANPATHDDAGTLDGTAAFAFVGGTLKQPPQTPIYFCIDFDPYDVPDAAANPAWPGPAPMPADWTRNWPARPAVAQREQWIKTYYENLKLARDAYAQATNRYYLIGAYAPGKALELLYRQGIVSHFWQAASNGRNGSRPPRWPYFHVNRWQYHTQDTWNTTPQTTPPFCTLGGSDPDADWGDGGTWSWLDRPGFALTSLENAMQHQLDQDFEDFLHPPALRPPPLPPF